MTTEVYQGPGRRRNREAESDAGYRHVLVCSDTAAALVALMVFFVRVSSIIAAVIVLSVDNIWDRFLWIIALTIVWMACVVVLYTMERVQTSVDVLVLLKLFSPLLLSPLFVMIVESQMLTEEFIRQGERFDILIAAMFVSAIQFAALNVRTVTRESEQLSSRKVMTMFAGTLLVTGVVVTSAVAVFNTVDHLSSSRAVLVFYVVVPALNGLLLIPKWNPRKERIIASHTYRMRETLDQDQASLIVVRDTGISSGASTTAVRVAGTLGVVGVALAAIYALVRSRGR